jgi:signal transduction histidine kinase
VQRLAPRLVTTLDKAIGFAQSVLDYGRESAAPPVPGPVDLRGLIEDAAFDARLVGHPGIAFVNGAPEGLSINVDAGQLARVFVNLLKNAREALESVAAPLVAPEVRVEVSQSEDGIVIAVTDNGPGLLPRARANLFVAFEGSARAGGTGLGLAIARELVEAHGGHLQWVEQSHGTRFEVALPTSVILR